MPAPPRNVECCRGAVGGPYAKPLVELLAEGQKPLGVSGARLDWGNGLRHLTKAWGCEEGQVDRWRGLGKELGICRRGWRRRGSELLPLAPCRARAKATHWSGQWVVGLWGNAPVLVCARQAQPPPTAGSATPDIPVWWRLSLTLGTTWRGLPCLQGHVGMIMLPPLVTSSQELGTDRARRLPDGAVPAALRPSEWPGLPPRGPCGVQEAGPVEEEPEGGLLATGSWASWGWECGEGPAALWEVGHCVPAPGRWAEPLTSRPSKKQKRHGHRRRQEAACPFRAG